ncbi:CHD3-type chromatin-remodeling factor PICKLE [Sesbania bispinosa]|nr:CHD3-type chromatin-remodeling factor PICKLE [Sesbania bispinosa]
MGRLCFRERSFFCAGIFKRVEDLNCVIQRWSSTTHTFFTAWGEFAPTLEDVYVLLKLPLFGDYDITSSPIDSHILDKAKELKAATIESAKYSREFLTRMRSEPSFVGGSFVKTPPQPPPEGDERPLEPRVWGWASGRPRHSLLDIIDEEDQFVHRPYTKNFFPGVEGLHRLYQQSEFASRNVRSTRVEGVFDVWQLILRPQIFPGFIITDTVSVAGGAFFPFSYRPDRLCRQFGLDQPPCHVDLEFCEVSVAMKAVLFGTNEGSLPFDSSKFIPPSDQGVSWTFGWHKIGSDRGKKRKPPKPTKEPATVLPSSEEGEGVPKKKAKASKTSHSDPPVTVAARKSAPRSSKAKKTPLLPGEKPSKNSSNSSSSSSPVEIVGKPGSPAPSTPVSHPGDDQTVQGSPSPSVAHTTTRGSFTAEAYLEGDGNNSSSTHGSGPIGDHDATPPGAALDGLVAEDTGATEQQNSLQVAKGASKLDDASSPLLEDPVVIPAALVPESSEINVSNPVGGVSIFSSLLPEEDARMLDDFASSPPSSFFLGVSLY